MKGLRLDFFPVLRRLSLSPFARSSSSVTRFLTVCTLCARSNWTTMPRSVWPDSDLWYKCVHVLHSLPLGQLCLHTHFRRPAFDSNGNTPARWRFGPLKHLAWQKLFVTQLPASVVREQENKLHSSVSMVTSKDLELSAKWLRNGCKKHPIWAL